MKALKTLMRYIIKSHLILAMLFIVASCGSDSASDNVVEDDSNSNNWNNPGRFNTPIYQNPNVPNNVQSTINQLKSSVGCVQGSDGVATYTGRRLNQNVTFSAQGGYGSANSTIVPYTGALQPGPIGNSGNTELFVGISVFGDLLFVTKYSQGTNVIGYNYTVSFCESQINYYNMQLPLISDQNQVVQLSNDSQTVLDFQGCQGTGMVDSADLTAYFQANGNYNYSGTPYGGFGGTLPFVTTFFPLSECGYYY